MSQGTTLRGARIPLAPLGSGEGRSRTWDQEVYVRFPGVYRALAAGIMRLPSRNRLRSRLLARFVTLTYAASDREDFELILLGQSPDFEYRPSPDLMPPDAAPVFHGSAGYLQLRRYWSDAFDDIGWEPQEIFDFGDLFLVATQQHGSGAASGLSLSVPILQLFEIRAGLIVSQHDFSDREAAFAELAKRLGRPVDLAA